MRRSKAQKDPDMRRDRFSRYFPRLFSYAYGLTGDAETAKDATVAAFATVLKEDQLTEPDFAHALFTAARHLCLKHRSPSREGLTAIEQEIVTLLFDAQLSRAEVEQLLGVGPETVVTTLVSGLKKLRAFSPPPSQPATGLQTLSA